MAQGELEIEVDMGSLNSIFIQAYEREINIWSDAAAADIDHFVRTMVIESRHVALITTNGIEEIRNALFKEEVVSDFIQSLSYRFFAYWGKNKVGIGQLCEVLSVALTQPTEESEADDKDNEVLLPPEYSDRYRTEGDLLKILNHNRWFIVICLIRLFVEHKRAPRVQQSEEGEGSAG
jgi:hypothetical protein